MFITVYMIDGMKLTGDESNILFFTGMGLGEPEAMAAVMQGNVVINADNVAYVRIADKTGIEHMSIHGY